MAEPITGVEMVDAYDTITGDKLAHQVPRSWIGSESFSNLAPTPKQAARDQRKPPPAKSADKATWVKYATTDAPPSLQLSKDAAEAMSLDDIQTYYTTAQEG